LSLYYEWDETRSHINVRDAFDGRHEWNRSATLGAYGDYQIPGDLEELVPEGRFQFLIYGSVALGCRVGAIFWFWRDIRGAMEFDEKSNKIMIGWRNRKEWNDFRDGIRITTHTYYRYHVIRNNKNLKSIFDCVGQTR